MRANDIGAMLRPAWVLLAVGAMAFVAIGAGCSSDDRTAAVVWSINDDGTVSLCGFEGLRTYQPGEGALADLADVAEGQTVRFEVVLGTEEDSEPTLQSLDANPGGQEFSC